MSKTKFAGMLLAALFITGCNRQEQALRERAGWPASSPEANPTGHASDSMQTAQQSYDLQFLDNMSAHHQEGVQMAQMAISKAQHSELKQMSQKMITDQQQEIEQMQRWRGQWSANQSQPTGTPGNQSQMTGTPSHQAEAARQGQSPAQTQATPGMSGSMHTDMSRLETATGRNFDVVFLEAMIPHHQSAVQMSQNALAQSGRQEIKQMAQKISESQQQEIAQMEQWLNSWRNQQGKPAR